MVDRGTCMPAEARLHTLARQLSARPASTSVTMAKRSPITTHVLDTSLGRPGAGIKVTLEQQSGGAYSQIGSGTTDADGRVATLLSVDHQLAAGIYRITFGTGEYMASTGRKCFYPEASITFEVENPAEHFHVPLLLNPFGFSTYRGS
mmetsp:Transcript_29436/g.69202  ORF Transcript_29436/g.69202 Transcript_29436/m.69202 type:complete len:148 (+) Transcript_29436:28-471(+)